jgi:hypothetical protein
MSSDITEAVAMMMIIDFAKRRWFEALRTNSLELY